MLILFRTPWFLPRVLRHASSVERHPRLALTRRDLFAWLGLIQHTIWNTTVQIALSVVTNELIVNPKKASESCSVVFIMI
jgi:hypothetical protein